MAGSALSHLQPTLHLPLSTFVPALGSDALPHLLWPYLQSGLGVIHCVRWVCIAMGPGRTWGGSLQMGYAGSLSLSIEFNQERLCWLSSLSLESCFELGLKKCELWVFKQIFLKLEHGIPRKTMDCWCELRLECTGWQLPLSYE